MKNFYLVIEKTFKGCVTVTKPRGPRCSSCSGRHFDSIIWHVSSPPMGNSWSSCFIVEKLAILIFLSSVTSRHDRVAPHCCFGQWHPRSVRSIMFLPFPKHPLASTNIFKYTDRHRRSAVTVRLRAGKVGAGQPPSFPPPPPPAGQPPAFQLQ